MASPDAKKSLLKKVMDKTGKVADAVTEVAGGTKLADYMGSKMAKMMAKPEERKYVADTTSGKDAMRSAMNVGMTVMPLGAAGAGMRIGANLMKSQKAMQAMAKMAPKYKVVQRGAEKQRILSDLIRGNMPVGQPRMGGIGRSAASARPGKRPKPEVPIRGVNKSQFDY